MTEEQKEKWFGENELTYYVLSAKVGWSKFMDVMDLQEGKAGISYFAPKGPERDKWLEESKRLSEQRIQVVKENRIRRDEFAKAHEDDIGFVDKIAGGTIEFITNPNDVLWEMLILYATGGMSLGLRLGIGAGANIAQAQYEAMRYEDRNLTPVEAGIVGGTSILIDGVSEILIPKAKNFITDQIDSFYSKTIKSGDVKVEPFKQICDVDNIGISDVAKQQQLQTDYGIKKGKPDVYLNETDNILNANIDVKSVKDKLDEIAAEGLDIRPLNTLDRHTYLDQDSTLNRTLDMYRTLDGPKFLIDTDANKEILKELKQTTGFDMNKNYIQNAVVMRKKLNRTVENLAKDIQPIVDDYYKRNPTGKEGFADTYRIVDLYEPLHKIQTDLETQYTYVQSEYLNKINSTRDVPIDLRTFISETGSENKDISKQLILDVLDGGKKLDEKYNSGTFFDTSIKDSIELDEIGMKVNLEEFDDYDIYMKKFGHIYDDEEIIKYDGNAIIEFAKANPADKDRIRRSLEDNPELYIEFVDKINKVLNLEVNKVDKELISEEFGISYNKLINAINKDKDYWVGQYKLIKEKVPIKEVDKDVKIWKRDVATRLNNEKFELAVQSTKINQNINKQDMIYEFEQYFEGGLVDESNKATVTLSKTKVEEFEKNVMPYFDDGIFQLQEGQDPIRVFAEFVSDLKYTRANAKKIGKYKEIGELRKPYFGNDSNMARFFATGYNEKYLKTNAQFIRNIFNTQSKRAASFITQGSTSPYFLINKIKYNFSKIYNNVVMPDQTIQQAKSNFIDHKIGKDILRFLENNQLPWERPTQTRTGKVVEGVRQQLQRGILSFTGLGEILGPNHLYGLFKSIHHFGSKTIPNTGMFFIHKLMRNSIKQGDSNYGKYTASYLAKKLDLGKYSKDLSKLGTAVDTADKVMFFFQEASDKQMKGIGDILATANLHNMKRYKSLDNELKHVLRLNGIDESNFDAFNKFVKQHIEDNGLYINDYVLNQQAEFGSEFAKALSNVYNTIGDYIGNAKHNSAFYTQSQEFISNWANLFRNTTRYMTLDMWNKIKYYTDVNGLARCRFNPYNIKDFKGNILLDAPLSFTLLASSGALANVIKEFQKANTLDQTLAIIETKSDKFIDLIQDKEFIKVLTIMANNTNANPLELLRSSDTIGDINKRLTSIWDAFTDDELNAMGLSRNKEGFEKFTEFVCRYFVSSIATNKYKAYKKYSEIGDIMSTERPYGFDKEDYEVYKANVLKWNERDLKGFIAKDRQIIKATESYYNNDTEAYDTLSKEEKDLADIIYNNHKNEIDESVIDFKSTHAYIVANTDKDNLSDGYRIMWNMDISKDLEQQTKAVEEPKPKEESKPQLTKDQMNRLQLILSFQKEKGLRDNINITQEDIDKYLRVRKTKGNFKDFSYAFYKEFGIDFIDFDNYTNK